MTPKLNISTTSASRPTLSKDGRTLTIHIPVTFRVQGGRKQIVTPPDATPWMRPAARVDNTMVKALVRAHRWRDMLEKGKYTTIRELAKAETINESYLCRVLRLALLSPQIVESILSGQQPAWLELEDLLKPMPSIWSTQIASWERS